MDNAPASKAPLIAIIAAAMATGGVIAFAAVLGVRRRVLEADGSETLTREPSHHPEPHPWLLKTPSPESRLRGGGFSPRVESIDLDPTPRTGTPVITGADP